jgi:hypothetical protein
MQPPSSIALYPEEMHRHSSGLCHENGSTDEVDRIVRHGRETNPRSGQKRQFDWNRVLPARHKASELLGYRDRAALPSEAEPRLS